MKKAKSHDKDELRRSYKPSDFPGGFTSGRYAARLEAGSNVVVLSPENAAAFPISEAVKAAHPDVDPMTRVECRRLIDAYLQWLEAELQVTQHDDFCEISTPFLDRHNDAITIYVEQRNGSIRLTDDGDTIRDLRSSGMEFKTEKRRAHLRSVLNGFGVRLDGDEISTVATTSDFPQKKHNLLQAMLAVNDMFVMAEEHVLSLFKEDVALFLQSHHIPVFSDFKLSGKSGFDHTFTSGCPRPRTDPSACCEP